MESNLKVIVQCDVQLWGVTLCMLVCSYPEDGDSVRLRNVGTWLRNCTLLRSHTYLSVTVCFIHLNTFLEQSTFLAGAKIAHSV